MEKHTAKSSFSNMIDLSGVMVNPEGRVPGMPGKPEEPPPNPQSCDTDCSQSREWDHQGCLGHFQEGQGGHFQVLGAQEIHPEVFPQFQYCGPSSDGIY